MATLTYRALWRWHFHAGLFCIPFVVVLALTGSIYLFKPQIDAFADRAVDSLPVIGKRATGEAQIAAALASLPGSKLFVYEIPAEPDDAVRVHLYAADGTGRIVYVHPETLEILKTVPHTARLTEIVRMIHGELLAGKTGSLLIELRPLLIGEELLVGKLRGTLQRGLIRVGPDALQIRIPPRRPAIGRCRCLPQQCSDGDNKSYDHEHADQSIPHLESPANGPPER